MERWCSGEQARRPRRSDAQSHACRRPPPLPPARPLLAPSPPGGRQAGWHVHVQLPQPSGSLSCCCLCRCAPHRVPCTQAPAPARFRLAGHRQAPPCPPPRPPQLRRHLPRPLLPHPPPHQLPPRSLLRPPTPPPQPRRPVSSARHPPAVLYTWARDQREQVHTQWHVNMATASEQTLQPSQLERPPATRRLITNARTRGVKLTHKL
jgi:hypothetical protein